MTSEQLVTYIQQGGKELLPILWERVKRLCFMLCGQYYSKYRERFAACGVELCDLRQECYAAFLAAVRSYKAESGGSNADAVANVPHTPAIKQQTPDPANNYGL